MVNETFDGNEQYSAIKDFKTLKRGQEVFIGDKPGARNCNSLEPAKAEHNFPSQWHSRFRQGYMSCSINEEKQYFDLANETLSGEKVYIFRAMSEIETIYVRKTGEKKKLTEFAKRLTVEGDELNRRHKWYEGARKFKAALELDSTNADAYSGFGYCLMKLTQYTEAVAVLSRV